MAFKGQVALVTGGASGMGKVSAERLLQQGAKVAIFDMSQAGLDEMTSRFPNALCLRCDVSNLEEVEAKVGEVISRLGPIDRLTHAAGIMPSWSVMETKVADYRRLMEINYMGTIHLIKTVVPAMQARDRGDVILFGSVAGWATPPKMAAYCASKSAVNIVGETLAVELRRTNLRICLVCPPAVNTPLIKQTLDTDAPKSIIEASQKGRLADPGKIIDAIENGIEKGKKVVYPGEARILQIWKILAPGLWWNVVMKFEEAAVKS